MEDSHATILDMATNDEEGKSTPIDKRLSYFGVYDGHGGDKVALYTGDNLHKIVAKQEAFKQGDLKKALQDGFLATDRAILSGRHLQDDPPLLTGLADSCNQTPNTKRKSPVALRQLQFLLRTKSTAYVDPRYLAKHLLNIAGQCRRLSNRLGNKGPGETVVLRPQAPERR
jgi:hypothetical protein